MTPKKYTSNYQSNISHVLSLLGSNQHSVSIYIGKDMMKIPGIFNVFQELKDISSK
jgi:hypothetical protein